MSRLVWVTSALIAVATAGCPRRASVPQASILESGRVILECQPLDASVTLDGVPMGLCSDYASVEHGLQMGAGMHHLVVRHSGRELYETEIGPDRVGARMHIELPPDPHAKESSRVEQR